MADGPRIAVIGNAGGGKSTLARRLSADLRIPHLELDRVLWSPDWTPSPPEAYEACHARMLAQASWVIDGLGRKESIAERLQRATAILLVDMPIWMHFWLAAERQSAWSRGSIDHPPAGASAPPPTEILFRTIFEIDRTWMPDIRLMIDREVQAGKRLVVIDSVAGLERAIDPKDLL